MIRDKIFNEKRELMKKALIIFLTLIIFMPTMVFAETLAKDLKETVESIDLEFKATDYKETEDQVTVYLFRWSSCEHCHEAISFFNDLAVTHGDKFKMRSFETTTNPDNMALQTRVANFLKIDAPGAPLIIIGHSSLYGFSSKHEEDLIKAIESNYKLEEKYDVFEAMEKNDEVKTNSSTFIFVGFAVVVLAIVIFLFIKKK